MRKQFLIFHNYYTPYRDVLFTLLSKKADLIVVYLQSPKDDNRLWDNQTGCGYHTHKLTSLKLGKLIFNTPFLPKRLKAKKFDKVVFIDNMPNLFMMLIYALFYFKNSNKVLWSEDFDIGKGCGKSLLKNILQRILRLLLLREIKEFWFFSKKTKRFWEQNFNLNYKKSRVLIQSPYSLAQLQAIPERQIIADRRNFGYLGYFSERKGLYELIHCVELISTKTPISLHIAGDGELKGFLKKKESKHIRLHPYIDKNHKFDFFSLIDFIILPSHKDPWGLVINEAMAHGVIPIVSDAVGAKEMVGDIGYIFKGGSSSSLNSALQWGLNLSNSDTAKRSALAKKRSRLYSNDINVKRILNSGHTYL